MDCIVVFKSQSFHGSHDAVIAVWLLLGRRELSVLRQHVKLLVGIYPRIHYLSKAQQLDQLLAHLEKSVVS